MKDSTHIRRIFLDTQNVENTLICEKTIGEGDLGLVVVRDKDMFGRLVLMSFYFYFLWHFSIGPGWIFSNLLFK